MFHRSRSFIRRVRRRDSIVLGARPENESGSRQHKTIAAKNECYRFTIRLKKWNSEPNLMKSKWLLLPTLLLAALLQGCIAFPPLIQVEHKDSPKDEEILKRLDAIDRRLDTL